MARFIIYKGDGLTNSPMTPTGYKFLGYDSGNLSEKTDNDISPIGGGGSSSFIGNTDTPNDYVGQAGKTVIVNGTEDALIFTDLPTGGSAINGTFFDFETLISNNDLVKGSFYEMTDFETIYDQPDYSNADTLKSVVLTKSGGITPILLLATSTNTFAREVWMPSRSQWKFEYDINFTQTEYTSVPAKGRITWAKDEFNNETTYDHDVVLLKRYESVSGSGVFNSFWDTGFTSVEIKTFGSLCFNNKIGNSGFEMGIGFFNIGNNVFGNNVHKNTFGNSIINNTFGNSIKYNTFGNDVHKNTFGNFIFHNTFGNSIGDTSFGRNNFGSNIQSNNFGSNIQSNNFAGNINSNTFNSISYATFISGVRFNIFEDVLYNINFTSATHVYAAYPCRIFKRQDGTFRLSYTDNTDTLVLVNPTS